MDSLTDWLRCRPAKPMVYPRLDSNPTVVEIAAHACRTYRDNGTYLTTSPLNFAVVLMFFVPDLIKRPLADSEMHRAGLASGQQHTTDHWITHLLTSIRRTKTRRDRCLHRPPTRAQVSATICAMGWAIRCKFTRCSVARRPQVW